MHKLIHPLLIEKTKTKKTLFISRELNSHSTTSSALLCDQCCDGIQCCKSKSLNYQHNSCNKGFQTGLNHEQLTSKFVWPWIYLSTWSFFLIHPSMMSCWKVNVVRKWFSLQSHPSSCSHSHHPPPPHPLLPVFPSQPPCFQDPLPTHTHTQTPSVLFIISCCVAEW